MRFVKLFTATALLSSLLVLSAQAQQAPAFSGCFEKSSGYTFTEYQEGDIHLGNPSADVVSYAYLVFDLTQLPEPSVITGATFSCQSAKLEGSFSTDISVKVREMVNFPNSENPAPQENVTAAVIENLSSEFRNDGYHQLILSDGVEGLRNAHLTGAGQWGFILDPDDYMSRDGDVTVITSATLDICYSEPNGSFGTLEIVSATADYDMHRISIEQTNTASLGSLSWYVIQEQYRAFDSEEWTDWTVTRPRAGDSYQEARGQNQDLTYSVSTPGVYKLRVLAYGSYGMCEPGVSEEIVYDPDGTSVRSEVAELPTTTSITGNYPNPFNGMTTVSFQLANAGNVSMKLYNLEGRLVGELVNSTMNAGAHSISANLNHLASGTYIVRMEAGSVVNTRKIQLLK